MIYSKCYLPENELKVFSV